MLKADKKLKALAQKLLDMSLENGRISEVRVQAVLQVLAANPPKRHRLLLKLYLNAVKREISRYEAIVEYAGSLDASLIKAIESKLSAMHERPITTRTQENPDLIAGIRVSLADNVYDASIAAQLDNLARSVN